MRFELFIPVTSYLVSGLLFVFLSFGTFIQYLHHHLVFLVLSQIQQEMKITTLFIKL